MVLGLFFCGATRKTKGDIGGAPAQGGRCHGNNTEKTPPALVDDAKSDNDQSRDQAKDPVCVADIALHGSYPGLL